MFPACTYILSRGSSVVKHFQITMPANQCILRNEGYGLRKKHAEKGMCIPASSKRVHIISSVRIAKSITDLCGCQVEVMRKNAIEQNLRQKSHSGRS